MCSKSIIVMCSIVDCRKREIAHEDVESISPFSAVKQIMTQMSGRLSRLTEMRYGTVAELSPTKNDTEKDWG